MNPAHFRKKLREFDIHYNVRIKGTPARTNRVIPQHSAPAIPDFSMSHQPQKSRFYGVFPIDLAQSLKQVEIELIQEAFRQSEGNQTHAAKLLNLKRSSLQYKIKTYKISLKSK